MKKSFSLYWKLFTSTFLLSAFTFGGGYVIVSLMKKKFVDELQWIDEKDILDLTAIAQSCPGPVAVNASILIGRKIAGLKGSLVAMLGTILPPLIGNLITIAEMTPGPIAINSSTFVGIQVGGMLGGIVATIGCVLPSCIIVSLLAFLYTKYKNLNAVQTVLAVLRPAVIGIIAFAGASILTLSIWGKNVNLTDADLFSAGIFILSLLAMIKFKKFSPMLVMLISGAAGILVYVLS